MKLYVPAFMRRGERALSERMNAEFTKIASAFDGISDAIANLSVGSALPSYSWTAWADSIDGTANFSNVAPGNRSFIGTATNRLTPVPSQFPEDYAWARFRGTDGEPGADALPLVVQWSVSGTGGWHLDYALGDRFQRSSVDGGQTFGPAVRVVGETGESVRFAFRRAVNQPATPPNTGEDIPAGWFDAPPADDGSSLWQTQSTFQANSQLSDWTLPVRLIPGGVKENADETATNQHRLSDVAEVIVSANYQGAVLAGQLPRIVEVERFLGATNRSADAAWSIEVPSGISATINNTAGVDQRGEVTITALTAAEVTLIVSSILDGIPLTRPITVRRSDAAPPQTTPGGGGGGSPGNPASDTTLDAIGNGSSHHPISDWLAVVVGSSGSVNLAAPVTYATGSAGNVDGEAAETPYAVASIKWVYSSDGVTGMADVGVEQMGSRAANYYDTAFKRRVTYNGDVSCTRTMTGLTPGATAYFRLHGRLSDGFMVAPSGLTASLGTATAAPQ